MSDFFTSPPTRARPAPTEAAAAERIKPTANKLRRDVLTWIREADVEGATARELAGRYARALGSAAITAQHEYTIRPRITELVHAGYVEDEFGAARDGCKLWYATDKPGDGSDARPHKRAKRIPEDDQRVPGSRRIHPPAAIVRRKSDGAYFLIPGEIEPEDHPGYYRRGGVEYQLIAALEDRSPAASGPDARALLRDAIAATAADLRGM